MAYGAKGREGCNELETLSGNVVVCEVNVCALRSHVVVRKHTIHVGRV